jgi:hypothetical protein
MHYIGTRIFLKNHGWFPPPFFRRSQRSLVQTPEMADFSAVFVQLSIFLFKIEKILKKNEVFSEK